MSTTTLSAAPKASAPTAMTPFACTFTPNLPELLQHLNCSIALTTFQAGKVVMISPRNNEELIQLPRTFHKAMGIAVQGDRMAVATKSEVVVLRNVPQLGQSYPKRPQTYDNFWYPQATFYTGAVDIHDLHFGKKDIWAVNTSFSCLCTIDSYHSFTPRWKPNFISKLASEDRCHLNGLAMENGAPKYVSALGTGDSFQSWRENITGGGAIIDVASNEIVAAELAMPHSPRLYNGKLYVLLSAAEQLICLDPQTGKYDVVAQLAGFVRGMDIIGEHLFIATSKLRKNSSTFKHLKIADKADKASVQVIHLPTGAKMAELHYTATVDEIYDVKILPNSQRPNIINTYTDAHHRGLVTPGGTFWAADIPEDLAATAPKVIAEK
ncbi:MAG: TIGR03032 family protein [Saprospiraceae bacterium]